MKKYFLCVLPFLFLLISCAADPGTTPSVEPETVMASSSVYRPVEYSQQQTDTIGTVPQALQDVEERGDCIVQGVLQDDAKPNIQYMDVILPSGEKQKVPTFGITVSTLKITKVYKGDLKAGDVVPLGERYFRLDYSDKTVVCHDGNYLPSETGKEYLFFLVDRMDETAWWGQDYLPVSTELGRYPVIAQNQMTAQSVDSMTNEELNLGKDDAANYKNIYKEVIAKYMS